MNLKQFKLTNNDEVVANVIDYNEVEDTLVVKDALKIFHAEDFDNNVRYYSFKPWMSFQDDIEGIVVIHLGHVISEVSPSTSLLLHYKEAVNQIKGMQDKRELNIDELIVETGGMSDEDLGNYLREKFDEIDSSNDNVIKFKPNNKLH